MQKRWVKVVVAVVALIVVVIGLAPFFINADTFRPKIENELSSALGRKVALGHLSLSLFAGSLAAENISIADDPAFGTQPFIDAKSLSIGVEIVPLLFQHQVRITTLTIDSPSMRLLQAPNDVWNFSSIGAAASPQSANDTSSVPDLTVGTLKIKNGSATIGSVPATGKPFVCTGINLAVQQFSFAKSFPFQLSASLPGAGSVDLSGTAGPLARKDAADTPFSATLQVKHFDLVAASVVDSGDGISMLVEVDAQLASDGASLTSTGKIQAAKLQLARTGSPAAQPVQVDYAVTNHLEARTGTVSDVAIHAGSVVAHVTGGYRLTPQAVVLDLRLAAPNLPIDQLAQLLPAVGIQLPSGSSLHGGTLTANLAITGPATAATIRGPVEIDNTQLAGFDLASKIQGITPFGGTAGGTGIQTLRAEVNASPRITEITNIYANMPQVGTASGSGTVSPAGALDFTLVAGFNPSTGVGALAGKAASGLSGMLSGLLHQKATVSANRIPLTITGTTTNPSIRANIGAMLK